MAKQNLQISLFPVISYDAKYNTQQAGETIAIGR